jgi:hypothetical protein
LGIALIGSALVIIILSILLYRHWRGPDGF